MKVLVTGGGGFLGGAIIRALLERGEAVRSIQRGHYPELIELGVESIQGDLCKTDDIDAAAMGCGIVYHIAALAGVWGDYDKYYQANVVATKNVINACKKHNINYLVYTSTPSVVFDGSSEEGIDESAPYSEVFFNAYQETKAGAEQLILASNNGKLKTVALRPHLIWGPGDRHLAPRVIRNAKAGRLRLVDNKNNKVDSCYIDNAVDAHLLAGDDLQKDEKCAGKAYFISNDEPIPMSDMINKILATASLPPITKSINKHVAYCMGNIFECVYSIFKIKREPLMTRFIAMQLSTSHWFDLTAAKRDLLYTPKISIDEGMKRLKASFDIENSDE
jgi:nucleoside-diphosphate-sugar epimerase|tara:strand:+ start:1804 stop:2805 length:1002 start_codon:yes stop_codon:yes gene_type:complete